MKTVNEILQLADTYERGCLQGLVKLARSRKLPSGKNRASSEDTSDASDNVIDLKDADDFSYSAIMRKMRERASKEQVREFLKLFKTQFDKAVKDKLQKPEKVALQNALIKFNKIHPVKVNKKLVKNASVSELGDPVLVGKYLADIVRFTLNKMAPDKRAKAIENLRRKFYAFNVNEIANKNLPPSSAIGQSITFVKHVLFNHDAQYVRDVLNNLVRNL